MKISMHVAVWSTFMTIGAAVKCKLPRKRVKLVSMADALNCGERLPGCVFPSENGGQGKKSKDSRAVKVVLNEFVAGSYTSLANVSHTIPLLLDALAVLSSSFQHKSQLFSSAPAPEASSWLACHSRVSSSNPTRLGVDTDTCLSLGFSYGRCEYSLSLCRVFIMHRRRLG